jgi:hypothetical protein
VTSFRNLANDADFQQISSSGDFSFFISFDGSKRNKKITPLICFTPKR